MEFKLDIVQCQTKADIDAKLHATLEQYAGLFPENKDAKIVLKPNLNSNMNALTGNTTDLRILGSLVEFFKQRAYTNISIGEGTNSGFYRYKIGVISRLKVDKLAKHHGVKAIDFNYAEPNEIDFEDGVIASVAKDAAQADLLVNVPKLKTHFEMGMSACLKNLMGTLIGQENKKKTHQSLAKNILNINKQLKPHLHIVDAMIAMEGLGPTRGTPVNTGCILVGNNPYIIDLVCAKIAGFDYKKVNTLRQAEAEGLITPEHHAFVETIDVSKIARKFLKPKANPLVAFIHSPKRQRHFLAIRNTRFFNWLCATKLFGYMLFLSGLRQDNFIEKDMTFEGLDFEKKLCQDGCTKCVDYCPTGIDARELTSKTNGCIECLYCYLVCPTEAITFRGEPGFFADQIGQYGEITKEVV